MIWGIIALILLLFIIVLVIVLLVNQSNVCPNKKKLNESCVNTIDCNPGLICSTGVSGITGTTGAAQVCKVNFGGTCSIGSDCAAGLNCINNVCTTTLGTLNRGCPCATGYTCINNICKAIVGKACNSDSDCATGVCINNVCGVTGSNNNHHYTDSSCNSSSKYDSSCDSSSKYDSSKYSYDSSKDSSSKYSYDSSKNSSYDSSKNSSSKYSYDSSKNSIKNSSYDSSSKYSYDSSKNSSKNSSYDSSSKYSYECKPKKCRRRYSSLSSNYSSRDSYVRRGVYVTNESNNDQTLFTSVEQPIIDIAKNGNGFLLLLDDGNLVSFVGSTNTLLITNKKMQRIVRFGTEIVGLDRKGKLYARNTTNTMTNTWNWEHVRNYPSDVQFIDSTNTPYNNLEVLTCRGKSFLYTFSSNWKNGDPTNVRKTRTPRYYGVNTSRYIDINETTNVGTTNDGTKVKHIKAGGFYNTGTLVSVLTEDTFTHVRIIDSNAYFLFEQC